MKRYEEKGINYLINKPGGLFLGRRRRSLRRTGGKVKYLDNVTSNWIIGITDSNGDYMYPKKFMGDRYSKALIKSLLLNQK